MHIIPKIFYWLQLSFVENVRKKMFGLRQITVRARRPEEWTYEHCLYPPVVKPGSAGTRKPAFVFWYARSTISTVKFRFLLLAFLTEQQSFIWKIFSISYLGLICGELIQSLYRSGVMLNYITWDQRSIVWITKIKIDAYTWIILRKKYDGVVLEKEQ